MGNFRRSASWRKGWPTSSRKIRNYPSSVIDSQATVSILQPYDPSSRPPHRLDPKPFHPSNNPLRPRIALQDALWTCRIPIPPNANSLQTNRIMKATDQESWLAESRRSEELRDAAWISRNVHSNNTKLKERTFRRRYTIRHHRRLYHVTSCSCLASFPEQKHIIQHPDSSRKRWCVCYERLTFQVNRMGSCDQRPHPHSRVTCKVCI